MAEPMAKHEELETGPAAAWLGQELTAPGADVGSRAWAGTAQPGPRVPSGPRASV